MPLERTPKLWKSPATHNFQLFRVTRNSRDFCSRKRAMHQGWQWAIKVPRADVLACACLPERIYERIVTQIARVRKMSTSLEFQAISENILSFL